MIPQGVEIFIATEPVDMRFGHHRLAGLVRERMQREPRSRALFVFFGRRRQTGDCQGRCRLTYAAKAVAA